MPLFLPGCFGWGKRLPKQLLQEVQCLQQGMRKIQADKASQRNTILKNFRTSGMSSTYKGNKQEATANVYNPCKVLP